MTHDNHLIDGVNKDINIAFPDRDVYLELTKDFKSQLASPLLEVHENITIVREDYLTGGTKKRAAEFYISKISRDVLVYVMPRVGMAAVAIMELAKLYNKEVIFFMPACKEISDHQAYVINQKPKEVIFERIAAMPNLNRLAQKYAQINDYAFLPFGLNHPYVIAGFVRVCEDLLKRYKEPQEIWTAVSTGVLTRGLQIGFPNAKMKGVCVARNMKAGELGRTEVVSEPLGFYDKEKNCNLPPVPTVPSYDGKVWKYIPKDHDCDIWFWNVAKDIQCPLGFNKSEVKSYKEWEKNNEVHQNT